MLTFAEKPKATQQNTSAKSTISHRWHFGHSYEVSPILNSQRTIGNQAVLRLLQSNTEELRPVPDTTATKRFGHDFSRIPLHATRPETTRIQAHHSSIPDAHRLGLPPTSTQVEPESRLVTRSFSPSFTPMAEPVSNGSLDKPEDPLGEFNEEETEAFSGPPVSAEEEAATVPNTTETPIAADVADVAEPAQAASATRTVIRGPREMWNFNQGNWEGNWGTL